MNSLICILLGSFFLTVLHAGPTKKAVGQLNCSCKKHLLQHYNAKNCTPIYEKGCDCPVRFICPPYHKNKEFCVVDGEFYKLGDLVDKGDPCESCSCRMSGIGPYISCMRQHPIFSMTAQEAAGCVPIFTKEECSVVGYSCGGYPQCHMDGIVYKKGERMQSKIDPCTTCFCDEDFRSTSGTNCRRRRCALEEYVYELQTGCVPLYSEETCCPWSFICANGAEELIPVENNEIEPDPLMQCVFGKIRGNIGDRMNPHSDSKADCVCRIPPDFTCIY